MKKSKYVRQLVAKAPQREPIPKAAVRRIISWMCHRLKLPVRAAKGLRSPQHDLNEPLDTSGRSWYYPRKEMEHMSNIQGIRASGAISYWSCQPTNRAALAAALQQYGFDGLLPDERTRESALKQALIEYTQLCRQSGVGDFIVLPHASTELQGYEVRGMTRNALENDVPFRFSLAPDNRLLTVTAGHVNADDLERITSAYRRELEMVTASQVGNVLIRVCQAMQGVCLRPNGGLYYVPQESVGEWQKVTAAVEQVGSNRVWIGTLVADSDSVRMVRDAITAEVRTEAELMANQVAANDLGKRGLENRISFAKRLREKVGFYENLLGETLDFLRTVIADSEQAASDALAAEEAGSEPVKMF